MIKIENVEHISTFKLPPHKDRSYLPSLYASGDEINFMMDSFIGSAMDMIDHCGVDSEYLYFHEPMFLPDGNLGMSVRMAYGYRYHYRAEPILSDMTGIFPNG